MALTSYWLLAAFLIPLALRSQEPPPPGRDGTLVEQTVCPPNRVSYERWLRGTERGYRQEVAEARRIGVAMQPFEALAPRLLSREEYEHRRGPLGRRLAGEDQRSPAHPARHRRLADQPARQRARPRRQAPGARQNL